MARRAARRRGRRSPPRSRCRCGWRGARAGRRRAPRSSASSAVPVADVDLELGAAPQAGRDLEPRRGRPRRPRSRAGSWPGSTRGSRTSSSRPATKRPRARAAPPSARRRPRRATSPAARAAAPAGRRRRRRRRARRGPEPCRPDRAAIEPSGTIACLRVPSRRPSGSNFIRRAKSATIAVIRASIPSSRTISRPAKRGDDLGGDVVGGRPEPAAGDDQVEPGVRRGTGARASRSSARSPTTSRSATSTPELARAARRPRARCGR